MNKKTIEKIFESAIWHITKYANREDYEKGKSYERIRFEENELTNEGINELTTVLGSEASGVKFDNANANLIVGTGVGAAAPADTEATFTAGVKAGMMVGYPTYGTDQGITWKAAFTELVANQAWQEFGVLNADTAGKLLNRKVEDQGTKVEGQIWELELQMTFA